MLAPEQFARDEPSLAAHRLWEQILKPVISEALDRREGGKPRHKGKFDESKQRTITFFDTRQCVLTRNGYSLRQRVKLRHGQPDLESAEATLKFRSPDMFISAEVVPKTGKSKFEEDIAPLIMTITSQDGGRNTSFSEPPSMRSLFSVSVTNDVDLDQISTVADLAANFPDLRRGLALAGAAEVSGDTKLNPGPRFREVVLSGASVDLGQKADADFDLSLWYDSNSVLVIAELSFKYGLEEAETVGPSARRALALFKKLQAKLGDLASPDHDTKTAMALPVACR